MDLNTLTVKQLRELAKKYNIKNYSNFTKQNFIDKISEKMKEEEKPKKSKSEKSQKYIKTYYALSPNGDEFEFTKKGLLFEYATKNGICNKGWVDKSIRENIPVKIGINKERRSKKYNGNGWRFYIRKELKK